MRRPELGCLFDQVDDGDERVELAEYAGDPDAGMPFDEGEPVERFARARQLPITSEHLRRRGGGL